MKNKTKKLLDNILVGTYGNMAGAFFYSHLIKGELVSLRYFLIATILTVFCSIFLLIVDEKLK